jgi:hypothetical protein
MEGAYEWALEYRYELEQYQGVDAEQAAAEAAAQGKPGGQDKYLLQVGVVGGVWRGLGSRDGVLHRQEPQGTQSQLQS